MVQAKQVRIEGSHRTSAENIRRLLAAEQRLISRLSDERVIELREFWQNDLPLTAKQVFKQQMSYEDKKLIWIWFRLQRVRHSLANRNRRKPAVSLT